MPEPYGHDIDPRSERKTGAQLLSQESSYPPREEQLGEWGEMFWDFEDTCQIFTSPAWSISIHVVLPVNFGFPSKIGIQESINYYCFMVLCRACAKCARVFWGILFQKVRFPPLPRWRSSDFHPPNAKWGSDFHPPIQKSISR